MASEVVIVKGGETYVCYEPLSVGSKGIWLRDNPLNHATPLLLMQLAAISLASLLIDLCLRPLGQSTLVSKICVGLFFSGLFELFPGNFITRWLVKSIHNVKG